MSVKVEDKGHYELFETTNGNHTLILNEGRWFAWVEGQQGEILVHTDSDHEKNHTIQEGQFYLVDFEDDPNYQDNPHLFLQNEDRFQELILPNGLPDDRGHQKRIVGTGKTVPQGELTGYLEQ
jgi:hypothetical protein